jgi:hypothetical protein
MTDDRPAVSNLSLPQPEPGAIAAADKNNKESSREFHDRLGEGSFVPYQGLTSSTSIPLCG